MIVRRDRPNRSRGPRAGVAALATTLALLLGVTAGCTGNEPDTRLPRFTDAPCPADVDAFLVQPHTCGRLEVAVDRHDPSAGTIALFVLRAQPFRGTPPVAPPMFVAGLDLAAQTDYAGVAPMAQRIGREVIMMDSRGTGLSEPDLACPEVRQLAPALVSHATTDADQRSNFLDAVAACGDRLTDDGIDLTDFGLADAAEDAIELRRALGIETWGVTTHGSYSRVAMELVRRDAGAIDSLVFDSPEFPGSDPYTSAITQTREGLSRAAAWCAANRACSRTTPDLGKAIDTALRRLRDTPIILSADQGSRVWFDDAALLRTLRAMLEGDILFVHQIAPLVKAVNTGALRRIEAMVADQLARDPGYCLGYLQQCAANHAVSEGALYTMLCGDLLPSLDPSRLQAAADNPTYVDAFVRSPYIDLCDAWPVTDLDSDATSPVHAEVPTLALVGALDPFSSETDAARALETLTPSWLRIFDGPAGGHDLLGAECPRTIRNRWLIRPTAPPPSSATCTAQPNGNPPLSSESR